MKFTLNWLKEHLETDADLATILDTMVSVGLEVEDVVDPRERLAAFTVGEILEATPHPDADKLQVCRVATKDGEKQIVCGAPNARAGIKVAYAPVGAYVPGIDVTLSRAKIRGVESFGMMCSDRELELGDDHDGIIEAPSKAAVGDPIVDALNIDDPVIDFEVTPNRPDTNGVAGVARDLAAAGLGRLITPAPSPVSSDRASSQAIGLHFEAASANACPHFVGRVVRGVRNGPSPEWLQDRLRAVGLRPINALVDITNYISYDRARPLHVYDADKLRGEIHARLGRSGERFRALDGKEYEVDDAMCVIADDSGVIGLGGVMGGEATGCTDETVNVFIESAYFDPLRTAKTGRKTGIISDARYRFERGVDPAFTEPGLDLATQLVVDFCGGEPSAAGAAGAAPVAETLIDFPPSEVARLTGLEPPAGQAEQILADLGFRVERSSHERWRVAAPSWRPDIGGKADLVEEIVRIIGFDALPTASLPPRLAVEKPKLTADQQRRRAVRYALAARGLNEVVTWSFTDERHAALFSDGAEWLRARGLMLANPIASDLAAMRPSILPNLLTALQRNTDRGAGDLALFEIAPVYMSDQPDGQRTAASGARRAAPPRHWRGASLAADVFSVKADALDALDAAGVAPSSLQIGAPGPAWFHPGRSGTLRLGPKNVMAAFGEIHPRVLKAMDVDGPVFAFEVDLDSAPARRAKAGKTRPALEAYELMPVVRDFAFVVDAAAPAADLLRAVRGADKALIAEVALFDVYEGEHLPEGSKSLAVQVTLQPKKQTLTDDEIEAVSKKIIAQAEKATGGKLRA